MIHFRDVVQSILIQYTLKYIDFSNCLLIHIWYPIFSCNAAREVTASLITFVRPCVRSSFHLLPFFVHHLFMLKTYAHSFLSVMSFENQNERLWSAIYGRFFALRTFQLETLLIVCISLYCMLSLFHLKLWFLFLKAPSINVFGLRH